MTTVVRLMSRQDGAGVSDRRAQVPWENPPRCAPPTHEIPEPLLLAAGRSEALVGVYGQRRARRSASGNGQVCAANIDGLLHGLGVDARDRSPQNVLRCRRLSRLLGQPAADFFGDFGCCGFRQFPGFCSVATDPESPRERDFHQFDAVSGTSSRLEADTDTGRRPRHVFNPSVMLSCVPIV